MLLIGLLASLSARAQDRTVDVSGLIQAAQQWATKNLDTNLLNALPKIDQQKAEQLLRNLQNQFQGEYIINLARVRNTANILLPVLENYETTQPYAAWLKPRLDYFKVADEFRLTIPPPKDEPGTPAPLVPNPSAARQREVWVTEVSHRSWPPLASNWVARLKPIFIEQAVPPELVWIAEVESSFDTRARSPVGAAGLFQLMPETAKRFGLSLWPQDQRYQPDSSARASAEYLRYLYQHFKDWRLALAAYNSGEGTVDRLLKRGTARTYDEIAGQLPAQTQMYVPKVEAVILRREGVRLDTLGPVGPAK